MKKLDILVTQYKEDESVIKPLLDSIEVQQGINKNDFRVVIINDGSDVILSQDFLDRYDYEIKYVKAAHKGISGARNEGIDNSDAEYIMFCDDDDMFCSAFGLFIIFERINEIDDEGNRGFDVLVPVFKEELKNEVGRSIFKNVGKDGDYNYTFIHGKVYRKQYLIDSNIRWKDDIFAHEDVYFNTLACAGTHYLKHESRSYYLWKYRNGSITRDGGNFIMDTCPELIKSYDYLIAELFRRGMIKNASLNTCNLIYRMYYESNTDKWINNPDRYNDMMIRMRKFYEKYKFLYDRVDYDSKVMLIKQIRPGFFNEDMIFEKISFNDWIKELETWKI